MYLYQNSGKLAPIMDAEGRCHQIPNEKPWEVKPQECNDVDQGGAPAMHTIPAEKVAKQLCDDGLLYGVVVVPEIREGLSIHFDVQTAALESIRVRTAAETALVKRYVDNSAQLRLQNLPVRPPSASIERILESRGLDLKRDFGVEPVNYKVSEAAAARDRELAETKKELAELRELIESLRDEKKRSRKLEPIVQ